MKKEYGVESEWRAFELRPGTPPEGMPRPLKPGEKHELSPSVKHLAEEVGLNMVRPDFTANSRPALEAAEFAKEKGKFEAFHLAVFKAYWEEAKNIGKRDVLKEIAESCGLDGADLLRALDEVRYAKAIDEQNIEAREMGVTGISAYVVSKYFIEGAQAYSVFEKAMARLQVKKKLNNSEPL